MAREESGYYGRMERGEELCWHCGDSRVRGRADWHLWRRFYDADEERDKRLACPPCVADLQAIPEYSDVPGRMAPGGHP